MGCSWSTKDHPGLDPDEIPVEQTPGEVGSPDSNTSESGGRKNTGFKAPWACDSSAEPNRSHPGSPQLQPADVWWPPVYVNYERGEISFSGFVGHDLLSVEGKDGAANVEPSKGDKLVRIDGEEVLGLSEQTSLGLLGGAEDSVVRLEFTHAGPGAAKYQTVEVCMKRSCPDRPLAREARLAGLKNPSNCCFMNATIQCCAHSYPDIHNIAGTASPRPVPNLSRTDMNIWRQDAEVATAYHDLCSAITVGTSGGEVADTTEFRKIVAPRVEIVVPPHEYQVQEDAHQFLVQLWGSIDNAMSKDGGRGFMGQNARKELEANETSARKQLHRADMTQPDEYATAVELMATLRWDSDCQQKDRKLQQLMWGQYAKGIGCPKCVMWVDVKPEVYNVLEVPVPEKPKGARSKSITTLEECVTMFFDQEKADKGTKCPRCTYHKGVEQKYVLLRLPECLAIVLKRYTYKADYHTVAKNNSCVRVPEVLDMSEHVFHTNSTNQQGSLYNLTGKVVHLGVSPRSGHYVAHVKHNKTGKWHIISDEQVSVLTARDEDEAATNAYMVFYRRDRTQNNRTPQ